VRIRVDGDVLAEAVGWTARCLPGRPVVPILAGMLLEARDDRLTLSAFDYEVAAVGGVRVTVEETGRALVSGRLLAEIARSLPNAPAHLELSGGKLVLRCGGTRFTLRTLPAEDYPALPAAPPFAGAVGADEFAAAVAQVCVAAARDDALPILACVRLELRGAALVLSCTDRFRVAVRELAWLPARADASAVAMVPARTLTTTARWLTAGAEVRIGLDGDGLIGFSWGGRSTVTRLLDHQPVDYVTRLIQPQARRVEVDTAAFVDALRRVALVAARHTPVRIGVGPDRIVLEAATGDEAHAVAELPASTPTLPVAPAPVPPAPVAPSTAAPSTAAPSTAAPAPVAPSPDRELTIAFNPQWLLDGVAAVDSDTTRLEFTEPGLAALITGKPSGPSADPGYRYLLMPVRLPGT
jgi:DNA polymerase III subunit beta